MNKEASIKFVENPKLLHHLKEHSYYIKYLNRDPNFFKSFVSDMKIIYKERVSDKVNNVIDSVDMVSSIVDTIK